MRRNMGLMVAVTLGLLSVLLLGKAALSQEPDVVPGGESPPGSSAHQSSEPISEEGEHLEPDVWQSSELIPTSEESASPAGGLAPAVVEETGAAPAQPYAYLRVAGSVLKPRDSDVGWQSSGSGACVHGVSGDEQTVWNAPIYLPQGATVKRLRMYWNDTNDSQDCWGWFTVYDYRGVLVNEWWVSSTGSAGLGYTDTDWFTHTIDYGDYSYVVNWRPRDLGTDMQLCGFRISYEVPPGAVFLPMILRSDW